MNAKFYFQKLTLYATLSLALLTATTSFPLETKAMLMPYPPSIERMQQSADTIIKARVISTAPAPYAPLDNGFWQVYRAKLEVITYFKGKAGKKMVDFFYRSQHPIATNTSKIYCDIGPENRAHFNLQPTHCYILFAANAGDCLSQFSTNYTLRSWEGFFACPDGRNSIHTKVSEAIWTELTASLKKPEAAQEAIMTLLALSCPEKTGTTGSDDYKREMVLKAIFNQEKNLPESCQNEAALSLIIKAIGSTSPFLSADTKMRYLWSRAYQPSLSWAPWQAANPLAIKPAMPFLLHIAEKSTSPHLKALAIASLGSCQSDRESAQLIKNKLVGWLNSPSAEVKAAAIILSSDYPESSQEAPLKNILQGAFGNPSPQVRAAAAYRAGITQEYAQAHNDDSISSLGHLLTDDNPQVQAAAGLSLLAYPPSNKQVYAILKAHLQSKTFGPTFTNRLAQSDARAFRDQLLDYCLSEASTKPDYYTDATTAFQNGLGCDPHYLCRQTLHHYLDNLSSLEIQKSEYKKYLEGLEKLAAKDSALTGKTYALLLSHKLDSRAQSFKKDTNKLQPGLPSIVFEQIEQELRSGTLKLK